MQTTVHHHTPAKLRRAVAEPPSLPLTVLSTALLLAGVGLGLFLVQWWPSDQQPHRPVENRVLPHVIIGAIVTFGMAHVTARRGSAVWMAWPISRGVWRRVNATVRGTFADGLGLLRTPALLLLGLVIGAAVLRIGMQVGLSVDPHRVINAWGGPTAVGAVAAVTVDALCVVAVACGLAHLVLRPDPYPRALRRRAVRTTPG
ncbi:hypothetical protein ACQBAR_14005 [Propionibacteriaceae bacterium Y1685]